MTLWGMMMSGVASWTSRASVCTCSNGSNVFRSSSSSSSVIHGPLGHRQVARGPCPKQAGLSSGVGRHEPHSLSDQRQADSL